MSITNLSLFVHFLKFNAMSDPRKAAEEAARKAERAAQEAKRSSEQAREAAKKAARG